MAHCGKFRAPDGTILSPPEWDKSNNETAQDWGKRTIAWNVAHVINTRCACDPDHPFRPTP